MMQTTQHRRRRGFTLIELLVVITIILIVSSIIIVSGGGSGGAALSASQRIVSGTMQAARTQAVLKRAKARVIIYGDSGTNDEIDKRLRFIGIVYEDSENPGQWIASDQGSYLPEGVYFDAEQSRAKSAAISTMNLEYPRASSQPESGPEYYYYEFDSNGTVSADKNKWCVVRSGKIDFDGTNYTVDFPDSAEDEGFFNAGALILRRTGTTTIVGEPSDVVN